MHVITVMFKIKEDHLEEFGVAMAQQARLSLQDEPGCHQFDVAADPNDATICFLYELYTDKAAFAVHRETPHFKDFDATVAPWLESKEVHAFTRTWPTA
jgi:quinol monooxygenase YgiN